MSAKPANTPFLAYQRFKQKEAEKEARIAAGEPLPGDLPAPWTIWSFIKPLFLLLLFTPVLGQFLTGSTAFGFEPQLRKAWRAYGPQRAMLEFTPVQLANYDGTDPKKPIYLAIDGDVYDVSSSARVYGPDGSYHMMCVSKRLRCADSPGRVAMPLVPLQQAALRRTSRTTSADSVRKSSRFVPFTLKSHL